MIENNKVNVMIDPSLIVAERTINNTFKLIGEFHEKGIFKFYLPKTFQNIIYQEKSYSRLTFKFFQQNAFPSERSKILGLIREYSDIIDTFEYSHEYIEKYGMFWDFLMKKRRFWGEYLDEYTLKIIFEEWIFLQEYSLIVSRVKRTFNKFIDAGAVCVQFGRKTFELLIRKTLKKNENEIIKKVDMLRAFGKWVAVGGPTITSLFNPAIVPFSSLISGYFLLFDPIATNNRRSYNLLR